MLKHFMKLTVALAALALWSLPASALSLESAGVEKGEAEIEYEGVYTDDNGEGVYEHEHEIEGELGILDWLKISVGFGFEEEEGERSFEFSEIEASVTVEIIDPEDGGFGLAIQAGIAKEFAAEDDEEDEKSFALGVIAEQEFDKWLVRGNLFYVTDIDGDEEQFDGVEYAYQVKYEFSERVAFGVEGYGSSLDFDEGGTENTHMIGPVVYFSRELGERHETSMKDDDDDDDDEEEGLELEGNIGVLFGTNDETPDVTIKWGIGLEF